MEFTATTPNSAQAWRPDLFTFDATQAVPQALILTATTQAGSIEGDAPVVRVAYCVDDTAEFVDEGAPIDEGEPGLNEALIYTRKFAQLVRLSNEQYRQKMTPEQLAESIGRAMVLKADSALLAQAAPTAPALAPVAGLLNQAGIVTQTGVATNIDSLIDLEATVRTNGALAEQSVWVMAPDTWAALRKFKTLTPADGTVSSNAGLLGAGTEDSSPRLLSIPVVVNKAMTSKTGLLIDKTAVISAVGPVYIATTDGQYFNSDSIGIRATWRTGHALPRPDRIGKFTLT